MERMKFDLMKPAPGNMEWFIDTMYYPHSSLFKFNAEKFKEWLFQERESLKDKPVICHFFDKNKTTIYINMNINKITQHGRRNIQA